EVTSQQSAKIDARIGQLCTPGACCRDVASQLNREFRLHWHQETYRRRAKKAGYSLGRTLRRLTPKESRQLDRRLRELCLAQMPGTEVRNTINREMGLNWTLQAYFRRAASLNLPWTYTRRAGLSNAESYLAEDQRKRC